MDALDQTNADMQYRFAYVMSAAAAYVQSGKFFVNDRLMRSIDNPGRTAGADFTMTSTAALRYYTGSHLANIVVHEWDHYDSARMTGASYPECVVSGFANAVTNTFLSPGC